jgi:hypothetical protein
MAFSSLWQTLRDQCAALGSETVLVTPSSERHFVVDATDDDRIAIRYLDTDEERSLRREQFEVLYDRLAADGASLSLRSLPAGVEPYASVLSLAPQFAVDEAADALRYDASGAGGESPFRRPAWTARTEPDRVRDDALLLVDLLERHDAADPGSLASETLVDLYVLLSDLQRGSDRLRRTLGDQLLAYVVPDAGLHGQFGTVHRTTRERRHLRGEETVLSALDDAGVPREWVLGVDPEKLDVVLSVTDLDEREVYDVEEQVYVQKTAVEEAEKQSRLQGLKDRLDALETEDAQRLRDDIEALEDRLDALLASG